MRGGGGALRMREDGGPGVLRAAEDRASVAPEAGALGLVGRRPERPHRAAPALPRSPEQAAWRAPGSWRSRRREAGQPTGAQGGVMSQGRPARRLPSLLVDPAEETVRRRCRDPINVDSLLVRAQPRRVPQRAPATCSPRRRRRRRVAGLRTRPGASRDRALLPPPPLFPASCSRSGPSSHPSTLFCQSSPVLLTVNGRLGAFLQKLLSRLRFRVLCSSWFSGPPDESILFLRSPPRRF